MRKAAAFVLIFSICSAFIPTAVSAENTDIITVQAEEFSGFAAGGEPRTLAQLAEAAQTREAGSGEGVTAGESTVKSVFINEDDTAEYEVTVSKTGRYSICITAGTRKFYDDIRPVISANGKEYITHSSYTSGLIPGTAMNYTQFMENNVGELDLEKGKNTISIASVSSAVSEAYSKTFLFDCFTLSYAGEISIEPIKISKTGNTVIDAGRYNPYTSTTADGNEINTVDYLGSKIPMLDSGDKASYNILAAESGLYDAYVTLIAGQEGELDATLMSDNRDINKRLEGVTDEAMEYYIGKLSVLNGDTSLSFSGSASVSLISLRLSPISEEIEEIEQQAIVIEAESSTSFHIDTSKLVDKANSTETDTKYIDHTNRNADSLEYGDTDKTIYIRLADWVEYDITVPDAGKYMFSMNVGSDRNVPFVLSVNGDEKNKKMFSMELTDGKFTQKVQDLCEIELKEGVNTIRIGIEDLSKNYNCLVDYIKLSYLDAFPINAYRADGRDIKESQEVFRATDFIRIYFGSEIDPESVSDSSVVIADDEGNTVSTDVAADLDEREILNVYILESLEYNTQYTLTVSDTIRSAQGRRLTGENQTFFKTGGKGYDIGKDSISGISADISYEKISINGTVLSSAGMPISGRSVTAEILDANGSRIAAVAGASGKNGSFELAYTIAEGSKQGNYTVRVKDEYSLSEATTVLYVSRATETEFVEALEKTEDADGVFVLLDSYKDKLGYDLDSDMADIAQKKQSFCSQFVGKSFDKISDFISFYYFALTAARLQSSEGSALEQAVYNEQNIQYLGLDYNAVIQIEDNKSEFLESVEEHKSIEDCTEYAAQLKRLIEQFAAKEYNKAPEIKASNINVYVGQGAEIQIGFTEKQSDAVYAEIKVEAEDDRLFEGVISGSGTREDNAIIFSSASAAPQILGSITITAPAAVGSYKINLCGTVVYKLGNTQIPFELAAQQIIVNVSNNSGSNKTTSNSGSPAGSYVPAPSPSTAPEPSDQGDAEYKFSDLDGYSWAEDSIYSLANSSHGIISKSEDKLYRPADNVTREEFTKMIITALGVHNPSLRAEFSDADENGWYSSYLASASKYGIISGYEDGSFGVGNSITRQDAALIIDRCVKSYNFVTSNDEKFSDDADISAYAKAAVYRVKNGGIISGMGDGSFAPLLNITRAQAAILIDKAIKNAQLGIPESSAADNASAEQTAQISNSDYDNYTLFTNLGVINTGSINKSQLSETATRETFARAFYEIAKGYAVDAEAVDFTDVAKDSELYSAACLGISGGFMQYDGSEFAPGENILSDEAAQALAGLVSLGMDSNETIFAKVKSAVYDGVKMNPDRSLSNAQLLKMIKNAVMYEYYEHGMENEKTTVLSKIFNVSVYRGTAGRVNSDNYTLSVHIDTNRYKTNYRLRENEDERYYAAGNVNLYNYEYLDAVFWVRDNADGTQQMLLVQPENGVMVKNAFIYKINGDSGEGNAYARDYINSVIFYDDSIRYSLAKDAEIVYNNSETSSPVPLVGNFVRAVIKDREIKTILVWDLEEGGIITDFSKNIITYIKGDTSGSRIKLEDFTQVLVYIDGVSSDIKDLRKDTVFSYYSDGDTLIIVDTEKSIIGTLDNVSSDEVEISGIIYQSREIYYSVNGEAQYHPGRTASGIIGKEVKAYFDPAGFCKYISADAAGTYAGMRMGIAIKYYCDEESGKDHLRVYMLEPALEKKEFEISEKVIYSDGLNEQTVIDNAMSKNGQSIYEFKINDEGIITEIGIPEAFPGFGAFEVTKISDSSDNYMSSNQNGTFYVEPDMRVLLMNTQDGECRVTEADWQNVRGRNVTSGTVIARIYGEENSARARCIIFCGDTQNMLRTEASSGIVSKRVQSVDSDGEDGYNITISGMEGDRTYFVDTATGSKLTVGTFLVYDGSAFFAKTELSVKWYMNFDGAMSLWNPEGRNNLRKGVVKKVDGRMLFLEDGTAKFMHKKFNYIIVDLGEESSPRFVSGSMEDLEPGAEILYYCPSDIQGIIVED